MAKTARVVKLPSAEQLLLYLGLQEELLTAFIAKALKTRRMKLHTYNSPHDDTSTTYIRMMFETKVITMGVNISKLPIMKLMRQKLAKAMAIKFVRMVAGADVYELLSKRKQRGWRDGICKLMHQAKAEAEQRQRSR